MCKIISAGIVAAIASYAAIGFASAAGPERIPQGHIYAPGEESLPPNHSRQADIEARADEFEARRYRSQLEKRRNIEQMNLNRFDFGNPNNILNNW